MGRARADPIRATPDATSIRTVEYVDAEGHPTDHAEAAVRGEITEYDAHGRLHRRTSFFLTERELPWLPVSEPAFLLWVLAALMLIWVAIGLVLHLV
jgi:hypothetical protein